MQHPHVGYAEDGSTELQSFLPGSHAERTKRTAWGSVGGLECRHPEIDLVDAPPEVKVNPLDLRGSIEPSGRQGRRLGPPPLFFSVLSSPSSFSSIFSLVPRLSSSRSNMHSLPSFRLSDL